MEKHWNLDQFLDASEYLDLDGEIDRIIKSAVESGNTDKPDSSIIRLKV